jgi:peptidoglycan glycosyltransferase
LNTALQEAAYLALDGQAGAVAAINPSTGEVLALVSSPSFDPTVLLGDDAADRWAELIADSARPLSDRSTAELYPPGSSFKTVVAAAAIDGGIAGPETTFEDTATFDLPGSTASIANADGRPCGGGIEVTLLVGFINSCNTVFADLAIQVGAEDIGRTAEAFGFNQEMAIPWAVARSAFPTALLAVDPAALAQSGIGERDVRATVLQMAMVAASVANDGLAMRPYLVARLVQADGTPAEVSQPDEIGRAMSPATATVLSQMMERVVTEGTGRRAAVPGVRVAGKTGTAASPAGPPHAWFIGFAPVEAPTIALAVLIESGGNTGESATGGTVAAPVAADLIDMWINR